MLLIKLPRPPTNCTKTHIFSYLAGNNTTFFVRYLIKALSSADSLTVISDYFQHTLEYEQI